MINLVFEIEQHFLVPKHVLLSKKDIEELFEKTMIKAEELPLILLADPAIKNLDPEKGDIVKIVRFSRTAGKTIYYRRVI